MLSQILCPYPTAPSATVTNYNGLTNTVGWTATEATAQQVMAAATLTKMSVFLVNPPGVGNSYVITFRKTGSPTALTVTISDAATSASVSPAVPVSVSDFDLVCVETAVTGTPAATGYMSVTFTNSQTGQQLTATANGNVASGATAFLAVNGSNTATGAAAEVNASMPVAAPGTISNFLIRSSLAPTGGTSHVGTVYLNGVAQLLSASIGAAATTASDQTNSFGVVQGDLISVVWANGTTGARPSTSLRFTPAVDGNAIYGTTDMGQLTAATTRSQMILCGTNSASTNIWTGTADITRQCLLTESCTVRSLYVSATNLSALSAATVVLRKNAVSQTLTATVTQPATTSADNANQVSASAGDLLNWRETNNSASSWDIKVGAVIFITPPVTSTGSTALLMGIG